MSELPNDQPHLWPKQSHAEDNIEQNEATSGEDQNRLASEQEGAPQSRSSTYEFSVRNISSTSTTSTMSSNSQPFNHESGALTNKLSDAEYVCKQVLFARYDGDSSTWP